MPLICVNFVIGLIPFIAWLIALTIAMLHIGTMLGLVGYGVYNAVERRCTPLPVIGSIFSFVATYPPGRTPPPPQLPPGM